MKRWLPIVLAVVFFAGMAKGQKTQPPANSNPAYTVGILPFNDVSGNTDIGPLAQALPKLLQSKLLEHSSLAPRQLDSGQAKGDSDSDSDTSTKVSDPASAASLGKAKHIDLVLMGQILSGNVETKDGNYNGPSIRGFSLSSKSRSQKSTVLLQIDVIDVNRGQRIGSFRATGSDTENKIDPSASSGYGSMDMTSTGFKDSSLGKATDQALNDLSAQIVTVAAKFTPAPASAHDASSKDDASASDKPAKSKGGDSSAKDSSAKGKTADAAAKSDSDSGDDDDKSSDAPAAPAAPAVLDGLVADVSGKTLILNVGKNADVRVGDTLKVGRTSREIKDPATGKVIRRIDTLLGTVTITQVDDLSSEGTYSGAPGVKVGDHVKR